MPRLPLTALSLALAAAAPFAFVPGPADASQMQAVQTQSGAGELAPSWMDPKISEGERKALQSAIGYQLPLFTDDLTWISEQQPAPEELEGDVVVLHSWNSETTLGRAMSRRVRSLLRPFGEDVAQLAVHIPTDAQETIDRYTSRGLKKLPAPSVVDPVGAYLDELGMYREPRILIADRSGTIRYNGVRISELRDLVSELVKEESPEKGEPLPPRDERLDESAGEVTSDAEFPAHNPRASSNANNLQGQRGPELVVDRYIVGEEPDIEGKVVMYEFWATWCGPCIAGIPHLNELQSSFEDDLVIVGISYEDEQTIRNAMRQRNLDFGYTVASDPQRRINGVVGNRGIPHCIVLSSDGIVRWQGHPASLNEDTMQQIVDANREINGSSTGVKRWVQPG